MAAPFDSVLSDPYLYFSGPQGAIRLKRSNRMGIEAVKRMPGMTQVNLPAYEHQARQIKKNAVDQKSLIRIRYLRSEQGL